MLAANRSPILNKNIYRPFSFINHYLNWKKPYIPHPAIREYVLSIAIVHVQLPEGNDDAVAPYPPTPFNVCPYPKIFKNNRIFSVRKKVFSFFIYRFFLVVKRFGIDNAVAM